MGYDTPRKLGDRETGGGLSLPIWINFMETALKGVPVTELPAPEGVVNVGGEWYYDEYAQGRAASAAWALRTTGSRCRRAPTAPVEGAEPRRAAAHQPPAARASDRRSILDLFRKLSVLRRREAQRLAGLLAGASATGRRRTRRCPWCPASCRPSNL